ncbi:hypothetical protein ACE7GA_02105 [Roseomonas sp. CCTCC AB2023176]|uniref:hypothetical protein n=1 Tax=Roseomonas sp. CCTCC AB2023176 TaxID=3342640 RepID=UPI0035DCBD57
MPPSFRPAILSLPALALLAVPPASAAEPGFLLAAGTGRTVPVFRDANAMEQGLRMLGDGAARQDPAALRALIACTVETGTAAQGQADMRIRRRRADTVEAWEVEVTAGASAGCKGTVAPVNFGRTPAGPTAAAKAREGGRAPRIREVGILIPVEGRADITLWASRNAREIGAPLARQGAAITNLAPYVACTVPAGTRIGTVEDGAVFRDVVVVDGPNRGCIGNVERAGFRRSEDQSVDGRIADTGAAREVAVWRDPAARLEGLRLVQAGTHRTDPGRVEALMACWAPTGATARATAFDPAAGGTQVEITEGPRRGCRGTVAEGAFRPAGL